MLKAALKHDLKQELVTNGKVLRKKMTRFPSNSHNKLFLLPQNMQKLGNIRIICNMMGWRAVSSTFISLKDPKSGHKIGQKRLTLCRSVTLNRFI